MTTGHQPVAVEMIPVDRITVVNPRFRNKRIFREIVDSISKVGLKKPITVSRRQGPDGEPAYELVCGQGRLEAFVALGQVEIPATVVDVTEEDRLIMSLVENLARRQHRPLELLRDIGELKKRGCSDTMIAEKTGLSYDYVRGIVHLLEEGEERLVSAVEAGQIPLSVALVIAEAEEEGAQEALAKAYEDGLLRGRRLLMARRLVERRRRRGKALRFGPQKREGSRVSSGSLVRAYEREAERQRLIIKKAEVTQNRLLFIVEAMRTLLRDENFVTLLRAEGQGTMPRPLADLVAVPKAGAA